MAWCWSLDLGLPCESCSFYNKLTHRNPWTMFILSSQFPQGPYSCPPPDSPPSDHTDPSGGSQSPRDLMLFSFLSLWQNTWDKWKSSLRTLDWTYLAIYCHPPSHPHHNKLTLNLKEIKTKNGKQKTRDMAWQLDPGSVLNTHMVVTTNRNSGSRRCDILCWPPQAPNMHVVHLHTYRACIHIR